MLQIMLDESQLKIAPADHEGCGVEGVSAMGVHGHVVWNFGSQDNQDQVCEDELVLKPHRPGSGQRSARVGRIGTAVARWPLVTGLWAQPALGGLHQLRCRPRQLEC